jgi:hypothetical protein
MDNGTTKKTTMDVARIMIRTTCQLVVDEFIDVKINGNIFHLRILEDSYGPMRILIPQNKNANGRDVVEESDEEEDEEEEEDRCVFMEEGEIAQEREREGEQNELVVLTPVVNAVNDNINPTTSVMERNNLVSYCSDSNSNSINSGGVISMKRGAEEEDSKIVEEDFCMDQEEGIGGPQNSTNTNLSITGGVVSSRPGHLDVNGPILSINSQNVSNAGSGEKQKKEGGVYSVGPRIVYNKLTQEGPTNTTVSCPIFQSKENSALVKRSIHPLPANIRRQNQIIHKLNLGIPLNSSSSAAIDSFSNRCEVSSARELEAVNRTSPTSKRGRSKPANSLSSAGAILCCSPIGSSEIRNCNSRFLIEHERDTATKVWKGAAELGVEGDAEDEFYVEKIRNNEKKEEEIRRLREQQKHGIP